MASTEENFSVLNVKCVEETGLKARSFSFLEAFEKPPWWRSNVSPNNSPQPPMDADKHGSRPEGFLAEES